MLPSELLQRLAACGTAPVAVVFSTECDTIHLWGLNQLQLPHRTRHLWVLCHQRMHLEARLRGADHIRRAWVTYCHRSRLSGLQSPPGSAFARGPQKPLQLLRIRMDSSIVSTCDEGNGHVSDFSANKSISLLAPSCLDRVIAGKLRIGFWLVPASLVRGLFLSLFA